MPEDQRDWICGLANTCQAIALTDVAVLRQALDGLSSFVLGSAVDLSGLPLVVVRDLLTSTLLNIAERLKADERTVRACWLVVTSMEEGQLRSCLTRAHELLSATLAHRRDESDGRSVLNHDLRVVAALSYIGANYAQPGLRLTDVASAVRLSACHFDRMFTKTVGVGFRAYVKSKRLEHARAALRDRQTSVKEAAYASGYKTPAAFCRDFRIRFGVSPGTYRDTSWQGRERDTRLTVGTAG
jgi:AraC-like DNA-binding protein